MKIKLMTDSSSDLPLSFVKENGDLLEVVGMPITIGSEEYVDDLGETLTHDYFYQKLNEGAMPKTSQINTMTFFDRFKVNHEAGFTTLYLGLSSGLSSTYNNACLAKSMMQEEIPEAEVEIVDTVAGSIGLGALVVYTLGLIREGRTVEEILGILETDKTKANHWFSVDNLIHLKNGGRIPAAVAYVGTVLNVKPILTMGYDGKLKSYSSVRGKRKAYRYLVSKVVEHVKNPETTLIIGHANIQKDADILVDELRKKGLKNKVIETCLSATIASHVGPGMMAIAFMGESEREKKE